eukprot:644214-Pyramimonas_sp.AAC.1
MHTWNHRKQQQSCATRPVFTAPHTQQRSSTLPTRLHCAALANPAGPESSWLSQGTGLSLLRTMAE